MLASISMQANCLLICVLVFNLSINNKCVYTFDKSRRLSWAGHVAKMEEGRSTFKILIGKPTGKRPLRRPWHR